MPRMEHITTQKHQNQNPAMKAHPIVHICAGNPTPEATAEIVRGAADITELKLQFAPTIVDDSTIQASIKRAITPSDELMPALPLLPLRNLSPSS